MTTEKIKQKANGTPQEEIDDLWKREEAGIAGADPSVFLLGNTPVTERTQVLRDGEWVTESYTIDTTRTSIFHSKFTTDGVLTVWAYNQSLNKRVIRKRRMSEPARETARRLHDLIEEEKEVIVMTDLKEKIKEAGLDVPPAWDPEEGDVLTGTVTGHEQARTRDRWEHAYIIEPDEGEPVSLWMDSHRLDRAHREGLKIVIRCEGEHPQLNRMIFTLQIDSD